MIEQIKKKIDVSLDSFLKKIQRKYKLHLVNPILFESIKDFTLREGKRIRPLLLILSYKGYSPRTRKLSAAFYNASTCIEFLHNFMLIHDDIIDRSSLRRGKPSLHKMLSKAAKTREQDKLGYDLSIIAGDIVYALAIDAFLSIKEDPGRKERALKYFVQTAAFTAMGEFIDILHSVQKIDQISEKDILLNYTLKTARYTFDCPLVVGAILAGAAPSDINKLSRLGIMIGQAFQIQDDIIGIYDSQKNIGKSILSDLLESKKTILVHHAYTRLPPKEKKIFMHYFSKSEKSYPDLLAVRKIFLRSNSLHYSLREIKWRLKKSEALMNQLKMKTYYLTLIKRVLLTLFQHSQKIAERNGVKVNLN